MKTIDEYKAIAKRDKGRGFDFYIDGTTRFTPEAATLRFVSQAADTLTFRCPADLISSTVEIWVKWRGSTVFRGVVESVTVRQGKGDDRTATVVASGPWARLSRYCLASPWNDWAGGAHSQWSGGKAMLPKHILNRNEDGDALAVMDAVNAILYAQGADGGAAAVCGISGVSGSLDTIELPADECRDITAADAIRRIMRWFPDAVVRFDYGADGVVMNFVSLRDVSNQQSTEYLDDPDIKKLSWETVKSSDYRDGAALMVETVSNGYVSYAFQEAGNASLSNIGCLRATLQVDGGTVSASTRRLKVSTEPRPDLTDVSWWKRHHPRLAGVAESAITITETFEDEAPFAHLCNASAAEMQGMGKAAQVESFGCLCKISTPDCIEEEVRLEMKFVTTDFDADGTERTIEVTDQIVAESGESVPPGLAHRILDGCFRANYAEGGLSVSSERVVIRLGDDFPKLGDARNYLLLQEIEIDCALETAALTFSEPSHLSPSDLAGMVTGFRNRRRPVSVYKRKNCADDKGVVSEAYGVRPISTSEWAPGVKAKDTLRFSGSDAEGHGSIELDCAKLADGEQMRVVALDDGTKVLATGKIAAGDGGMFRWDAATRTIGGGCVCIGRTVANVAAMAGCADGRYFLRCILKDKTAAIHLGATDAADDAYNFAYVPLYDIDGGKVANDYRGMPTVTAYE